LDEIQTNVLRVFHLAIQSPLQFCLKIYISSNSRNLLQFLEYTVKEKGGKPDRKSCPLPYGLRNPYRSLKSENSQDYAQKPQRNCMFTNSSSEQRRGGAAAYLCSVPLYTAVGLGSLKQKYSRLSEVSQLKYRLLRVDKFAKELSGE
jgi:hypothetical protein